jgi:threonine synthase
LQHDPPAVRGDELRERFDERLRPPPIGAPADCVSGVWRFRELVMPETADAEIISQPEGNTPLLSRDVITKWCGVGALHLKHEGYNPTGSFKDRGMTVAVTQAKRARASAVACASTGNTSSSLAAYAALAGIPALVLVPSGQVADGKLAQTLAYGARTLLVRGNFDDCLRLVRESAHQLGVYLANSINPYRLEGQKTIVLELLQQLGWRAPDWIALPAGNLGNTAAFGTALRDAHALGLIDRVPRLAAIQAAGAAPFAASFRGGFTERVTVKPETVATAIRIGDPASYERAVVSIRETNGVVIDLPDSAILEGKAIVDASGIGCEPASAASVAGVRALVRQGVITPRAHVVCILTGHILKDPGILLEYHESGSPGANPPVEIDVSLAAVERVLTRR